MTEINARIGHKDYTLHAQPGEERLVRRAAALLDEEAQKILSQAGRMPEQRLLLLVSLLAADRVIAAEDRAAQAERELSRLKSTATVAGIPTDLRDQLRELAEMAEQLADRVTTG